MCHIASAILLSKLASFTPSAGVAEVKKKRLEVTNDAHVITEKAVHSPKPLTSPQPTPISSTMVADKPAVPTPNPGIKKGWGKISSSSSLPNLNKIFEEKADVEDDEPDLVQGNEFNEVTFNTFITKWNAFADSLKKTSRITLYTIMTANPPRLNGVMIEVDVENAVQMDELKLGKIDILNYLRVELRNFSLDLTGVQVEVTRVRKPYTSAEKYQAMLSKNPSLETLRKAFNLGLS